MEEGLSIRVGRPQEGRLAIALAGELDMPATFTLEPELERHMADDDVSRLELDLNEVEFMDSAGLGALLSSRQRAADLGVELAVTNPSPVVLRVLELTGTSELLGP